MIQSPTLTSAVSAELSPLDAFLSRTLGRVIVAMHHDQYPLYMNANVAELFLNPYTRRQVYRDAHGDAALAAKIMKADPLYAQRSQLSATEKAIRNIAERILFVPLAGIEGVIGGPIDYIENKFYDGQRTRVGRMFDDFMYTFTDMFHRKRLLYTLTLPE